MSQQDGILKDRLADFTQDKRILLLALMALFIGAMSAFVAKALIWLINVISNLTFYQAFSSIYEPLTHHHLGLWVILVPALGGLIIGLMARYGSEKIRGHGIPEALEAILFGQSKMNPKVAVLKPISSAISIGTGGPFGAEGPIIMTGGAFGSLFAQFFHLSSAERKTLLVAGAAAGMSAIFATPVAAVLLAVELLLFEWRPRSFIPVAVASTVAAALRVPLLGQGPIFLVVPHAPLGAEGLAFACVVGILAGLGSGLLTTLVYTFEDLFQKLPIHWMWWPTLGGLFVGLVGAWDPRVLGVGYDTIHALLQGHMTPMAALSLMASKSVAWSVALGSGTSGGVLAPLLMMGGALGALEATWLPVGDMSLWAMVSMASMMGGTMRSPLTAMIFTLELTHDLNALLPLMVGCVSAHLITVLLLRRSILTEKIARRGYHIMREYSVDPYSLLRVADAMDPAVLKIPNTMKLMDYSNRIRERDPEYTRHQAAFIVDEADALVGIITHSDVFRTLECQEAGDMTVLDAGKPNPVTAYPDDLLQEAVAKMLRHNIGRLPIVQRENASEIVGYLGRSAIISARAKQLEEEHVRESGWFGKAPA